MANPAFANSPISVPKWDLDNKAGPVNLVCRAKGEKFQDRLPFLWLEGHRKNPEPLEPNKLYYAAPTAPGRSKIMRTPCTIILDMSDTQAAVLLETIQEAMDARGAVWIGRPNRSIESPPIIGLPLDPTNTSPDLGAIVLPAEKYVGGDVLVVGGGWSNAADTVNLPVTHPYSIGAGSPGQCAANGWLVGGSGSAGSATYNGHDVTATPSEVGMAYAAKMIAAKARFRRFLAITYESASMEGINVYNAFTQAVHCLIPGPGMATGLIFTTSAPCGHTLQTILDKTKAIYDSLMAPMGSSSMSIYAPGAGDPESTVLATTLGPIIKDWLEGA